MAITKTERMFRMTQATTNEGGRFTEWVCPNRFKVLNISVRDVVDSVVSLQRRAEVNRDRGLFVEPGTVKTYTEDTEDDVRDYGTGVEYRLGIESGNHGTDSPKLILWG
ncbi:MAG: hypothetical protein U5L00_06720 [Desulfovermiculus sp.]|nr:hypothetical protein [Desulfovermiculus sp.]